MTYGEALAYISSLEPRGWRLGLDRMQEFLRRAGLSNSLGGHGGPNFIHVAGTNGKGSVTAYLQSILVEQGYRTGAFFSPFVYDPRERVQFGRELIPEHELARLTEWLKPFADSLAETEFGGATEFEFKTALGFAYWAEQRCDWVALETGLGGRLDATNVVYPKASVIVSIGLDHTNILGTTPAQIAGEKAGIIKPGVPVVVGEMGKQAGDVIIEAAARLGSEVWLYGADVRLAVRGDAFDVSTPRGAHRKLIPGLTGVAQPHNMALAVAAIDAANALKSEAALAAGVARASLPGRFERRNRDGVEVILDGAHNAEAAKVLRDNLDSFFPCRRIVLVTAMVGGHDPARFFQAIAPRVDRVFVAPLNFHRAIPAESLRETLSTLGLESELAGGVEEAVSRALTAASPDGLVLVTGSFYLVGEAGQCLAACG